MKRIITISLFTIIFCCSSRAQECVDSVSWNQKITERLDDLLDNSFFEKTQLGFMVYDLTADSMLYAKHEKMILRPASTMKILTAVTALDNLGGDYKFRTSLYYDGELKGNILEGDIYCKGGFDPAFCSKDMESLIAAITSSGIDTIRGHIYADVSFKDATKYGEGWCWDDENFVLTPLPYNRKLNEVFMDVFQRRLSEKVCLIEDSCEHKKTKVVPSSAIFLTERTHPISTILNRMMKISDNLYAESMLYHIAHDYKGNNASAKDGLRKIKSLVTRLGFRASDYRLADGSGLSLYNYVSAELECAFLKYAFQNNDIFYYLYPSLPIAGKDGTLEKRMKRTVAAGNVHAKTGSVSGVSSLAGYLTSSNGHFLCFSIINQGVMKLSESKFFQNRICQILCNP
ncbi:MAG: D-alanyl-D-alanine carboxypeptidase/D-alanyl-D-alanine-endopeptidase [Prevotella sp.]|nr:D-alanyl-D-alanine carboxypeptidase/D-alanyl-D-alanine-endopeptidase [Candidatus Equicola stercoris]